MSWEDRSHQLGMPPSFQLQIFLFLLSPCPFLSALHYCFQILMIKDVSFLLPKVRDSTLSYLLIFSSKSLCYFLFIWIFKFSPSAKSLPSLLLPSHPIETLILCIFVWRDTLSGCLREFKSHACSFAAREPWKAGIWTFSFCHWRWAWLLTKFMKVMGYSEDCQVGESLLGEW